MRKGLHEAFFEGCGICAICKPPGILGSDKFDINHNWGILFRDFRDSDSCEKVTARKK